MSSANEIKQRILQEINSLSNESTAIEAAAFLGEQLASIVEQFYLDQGIISKESTIEFGGKKITIHSKDK